jgi:hypothetical protein
MKQVLAVTCAVYLVGVPLAAGAQQADAAGSLVSSWTLAAAERGIASGQPSRVPGARGLLVLDNAGNVFEYFIAANGDRPESARSGPQQAFADNGGFWGRYEVVAAGRIDFEAEAGVSPNVRGLMFSRHYQLDGDRLVITSTDEPQAQGDIRLTWQRVPTVEHLTPAYREVVGFWRHVEEQRVDTATGEVESTRQRAPSVIVYTAGGFVGVHFPALGRSPFAAEAPTEAEAQAAFGSYIGYYGALGVYPGEVFHNVLGGLQPGAGAILRRYADITGDELVVTIPGANPQAPIVTTVRLRRLSGIEDMLPR